MALIVQVFIVGRTLVFFGGGAKGRMDGSPDLQQFMAGVGDRYEGHVDVNDWFVRPGFVPSKRRRDGREHAANVKGKRYGK